MMIFEEEAGNVHEKRRRRRLVIDRYTTTRSVLLQVLEYRPEESENVFQLENSQTIGTNPFPGDGGGGIGETSVVVNDLTESRENSDEDEGISVDLNDDMETTDEEEATLPSPVVNRSEHAIIERGEMDDHAFGAYLNSPLTGDERRCLERYSSGQRTTRRNTDVYLRIPNQSFRKLRPVPVSGSYRARDYWFDDLIINQYMILLSKRDALKNPRGRKSYFVDPLASNQLMEWMRTGCHTSLGLLKNRFQSIRHRRSTGPPGDCVLTRWMPAESILELDYIFIPINTENSHFVLGFIDLKHKVTYVFDSLGSNRPALSYQLYSLMRELLGMDEERWRLTDWRWTTTNLGCVPIQPNCCDCGMYVCLMTNVLAVNQGLHHIHRDNGNYRLRMAHEILNNAIP